MVSIDRVVVVVPVRDGEAAVGAAETIAEALDLTGTTGTTGSTGGDVEVVCIGTDCAAAWNGLCDDGFADIAATLYEAGPFAPAAWTAALDSLIADADVVLAPASADGRDLAPRLAAQRGSAFVAGAIAVEASRVLVPRADGRALCEIPTTTPLVATLQPGVRTARRDPRGEAVAPTVTRVPDAADGVVDAEVLEVLPADAATMDLAEAPFILGAGMGLGTEAAVETLASVAAGLDASIGATRVITDEGWMSHDRQIGTTGVVVDPTVYVAFGVSGAVQHTSGLGDPDHVISVNTDPHCPMMQRSDVAIVADAPAVVAELQRRLVADTDREEDHA